MIPRFIIVHPDLGVFLGDSIVRRAWSKGEHQRLETAASFDTLEAASAFLDEMKARIVDDPDRLAIKGVQTAAGDVTPDDLRAAGLRDVIGEMDANLVRNPWFDEIAATYRRLRNDGVGPPEAIVPGPDEPNSYDYARAGAQLLYEAISAPRAQREQFFQAVVDEIEAQRTSSAGFQPPQPVGPAQQLATLYALGAGIETVDALFVSSFSQDDGPTPAP